MLDSCTIHLGRIDLLEDKTEGEWYAHLAIAAGKVFNEWSSENTKFHQLAIEDEESLLKEIRSLKQRSYISSWFSSDYLSIAMWKLYGITHEGIAIRVKKERLKKLQDINAEYIRGLKGEMLFSKVIYVDDNAAEMKKLIDENSGDEGWLKFRNLLLKHKAYKFEEEYRMSVILPPEIDPPFGIKLNIGPDLNEFIDAIYLNPLIHSEHWYIKVVRKIMEVFNLDSDKLSLAEIRTALE
jgi:hypothetical protein